MGNASDKVGIYTDLLGKVLTIIVPSPSMFFGNLFVYFQFQGKTQIDHDTRQVIFAVLIGVAVIGVFFLAMLRRSEEHLEIATREDMEKQSHSRDNSIMGAFLNAINLFCTKNMLLLSVTFLYTGKCIKCKISRPQ